MSHVFVSVVLLLTFASYGRGSTFSVLTETSAVSFLATGNPGFIRINGSGGKVRGIAEVSEKNKVLSGEFHVALDQLTTDMSLRDRHMKNNYLEIEKFPEAVLKFDDVSFELQSKDFNTELVGMLSLHGVTRPIKVQLQFRSPSSEVIHIEAKMNVILSDFEIKIPSFASVTVAKELDVQVALDAKPTVIGVTK